MARGYIGSDWLEDRDLPISKKAWTNIQKRKDPRLLEEASFKAANPSLEWNRDILNQAGQGWKTNFLPSAKVNSIDAISKMSAAEQTAIGLAQDYGGYVSPKQAALYSKGGVETIIDGSKETGAGAGMGGKAPGGTPWGLISAGLGFLSKITDKSKKGQPGVSNAGNLGNQLQAGSFDWMKFFA